jgi:hypothetical protein
VIVGVTCTVGVVEGVIVGVNVRVIVAVAVFVGYGVDVDVAVPVGIKTSSALTSEVGVTWR